MSFVLSVCFSSRFFDQFGVSCPKSQCIKFSFLEVYFLGPINFYNPTFLNQMKIFLSTPFSWTSCYMIFGSSDFGEADGVRFLNNFRSINFGLQFRSSAAPLNLLFHHVESSFHISHYCHVSFLMCLTHFLV